MSLKTFHASRWTRGNFLFPTVIEVTDEAVIWRKRSWFRLTEIPIPIIKVTAIRKNSRFLWTNMFIESPDTSGPLACSGFWRWDARRIEKMIEEGQWIAGGKPGK